MENIPSAEEHFKKFFDSFPRYGKYLATNWEKEIRELAIEFAKLHVRAALEAANQNIEYHSEYDPEWSYCSVTIDKDSILNAYPEENIK